MQSSENSNLLILSPQRRFCLLYLDHSFHWYISLCVKNFTLCRIYIPWSCSDPLITFKSPSSPLHFCPTFSVKLDYSSIQVYASHLQYAFNPICYLDFCNSYSNHVTCLIVSQQHLVPINHLIEENQDWFGNMWEVWPKSIIHLIIFNRFWNG